MAMVFITETEKPLWPHRFEHMFTLWAEPWFFSTGTWIGVWEYCLPRLRDTYPVIDRLEACHVPYAVMLADLESTLRFETAPDPVSDLHAIAELMIFSIHLDDDGMVYARLIGG